MTLLGAGGAATAVCTQAALDGVANINVFSIRDQFFDRAQKMVDNINASTNCKAALYDLADKTVLNKSIGNSHYFGPVNLTAYSLQLLQTQYQAQKAFCLL